MHYQFYCKYLAVSLSFEPNRQMLLNSNSNIICTDRFLFGNCSFSRTFLSTFNFNLSGFMCVYLILKYIFINAKWHHSGSSNCIQHHKLDTFLFTRFRNWIYISLTSQSDFNTKPLFIFFFFLYRVIYFPCGRLFWCLALSLACIHSSLGLHLLAIYVDICSVYFFIFIRGYAIYIHSISRKVFIQMFLYLFFVRIIDFYSNRTDEFKVFVNDGQCLWS